jgi:hypothetical protein
MKLAIHSVFIAKENIMFLEEWIDYHSQLGFDYFYLYDNSKVQLRCAFECLPGTYSKTVPGKINKYGYDYNKLIPLTDEEIHYILQKIKEKYNGRVIIIEWSPRNKEGLVCYNQQEAHMDCLSKLKKTDIDWCASIDMDEYINLKGDIKQYIQSLDKNIKYISMGQVRFGSRFTNMDKLVTQINDREIKDIPSHEGPKYLYSIQHTIIVNIHSCKVNGSKICPTQDIICINHYKISDMKYLQKNISTINKSILDRLIANSSDYIISKVIKKSI